jgi:hypothetical protein
MLKAITIDNARHMLAPGSVYYYSFTLNVTPSPFALPVTKAFEEV